MSFRTRWPLSPAVAAISVAPFRSSWLPPVHASASTTPMMKTVPETLAQIRAAGGQAIVHRADVTDATAVAGLVAAAQAAFGERIDLLVNVAGGMVQRRPLADIDPAFFHTVMDLNLTSTYLTTHAVVPHMREGAAIVNFASQAGRDGGGPGASIYATAKAAVMTFTRAMARSWGRRVSG